jgi:precorrin-6B methylase 2
VKRCLRIGLLSCTLLAAWLSATAATAPQKATEVTLKLTVPESREYEPHRGRPRTYLLTIDGKDYSEPKETSRTIKVPLKDGQEKITIKYSFWTNNYTNFVRTKIAPVEKGKKSYTIDMTMEDPKNRDHVEPIYVPTPQEVAEAMSKLAKVGKNDVVWDIGCGDGRTVITAVKKFGAKKGLGLDIDKDLIDVCRSNAKKEKVDDRVEFKVADALKIKDASEASVVLLYLGDDLNLRLRPLLQNTLKPGSRVVSHRFLMGDWKPDQTVKVNARNNSGFPDEYELHLWVIKDRKKEQ